MDNPEKLTKCQSQMDNPEKLTKCQSQMDNPEKDVDRQNKNTTQWYTNIHDHVSVENKI